MPFFPCRSGLSNILSILSESLQSSQIISLASKPCMPTLGLMDHRWWIPGIFPGTCRQEGQSFVCSQGLWSEKQLHSRRLTWKLPEGGGGWKTTFLLGNPSVHFHVCWWEGTFFFFFFGGGRGHFQPRLGCQKIAPRETGETETAKVLQERAANLRLGQFAHRHWP